MTSKNTSIQNANTPSHPYKIFLSSTQCMMLHYRQTAIAAILNATPSQLPITQEYDFMADNQTAPVDLVEKKIKEADAVILLVGMYYGSMIKGKKCAGCSLKDSCSYRNRDDADAECNISYTHFEYLLAKQSNKPIHVLIHAGIDEKNAQCDDELFPECRKKCKEACDIFNSYGIHNRSCDNCKGKVREPSSSSNFYRWVKEIRNNDVGEFKDCVTLKNQVSSRVQKIVRELDAAAPAAPINKFDEETIKELAEIGVIRCTEKLKDTEFAPMNCMKAIKKHLDFIGIMGAKWIERTEARNALDRLLVKLSTNSGKVRFLLIDPTCEDFEKFKLLRDGLIKTAAYQLWLDMAKKYPKYLEVRLYSHLPAFRLQLMDESQVAISKYPFDSEDHEKAGRGWESPHLIIGSGSTFSFYDVFERYFESEWDAARDIREVPNLPKE